jgi:hypothetical protein
LEAGPFVRLLRLGVNIISDFVRSWQANIEHYQSDNSSQHQQYKRSKTVQTLFVFEVLPPQCLAWFGYSIKPFPNGGYVCS